MHYVFRSRADADLIMMQAAAEQILGVVGKAPAAQGIIELGAIAAAMQALREAIALEDAAVRHSRPVTQEEEEVSKAERVGLNQRAWPLLEMMRRSLAEKCDIVWGV
jgi:Domain of unknown function (DUF1840)